MRSIIGKDAAIALSRLAERRGCNRKIGHRSFAVAESARLAMVGAMRPGTDRLRSYFCDPLRAFGGCGLWHVGNVPSGKREYGSGSDLSDVPQAFSGDLPSIRGSRDALREADAAPAEGETHDGVVARGRQDRPQ